MIAVPRQRERVAAALRRLSEADLLRLRRIAQLRARALPDLTWTDLLNEAVLRALDGTRRWPERLPLLVFLAGIMRSLAEEYWRQHRARDALFRPMLGGPGFGEPLAVIDAAADPERDLHAQRCLDAIDSLFARDADALHVIAGLGEGLGPAEIQARYGMDETRYATVRRRIRRTLLRAYGGKDWR